MKKDKWVWLGLILVILSIVLTIWLKNRELSGSDYRIGVFGDDGVAVVSISKSRQMINVLKVSPEAKMWIPGGMGWYRSEVVKKILNQENKKDLFDQILFCNPSCRHKAGRNRSKSGAGFLSGRMVRQ